MDCPLCSGKLVRKKVSYSYAGFEFGKYDADVCNKCGEEFFSEKSMDKVILKAKELGVWGLSTHTKIGYSGNSLMVRISKDIANFMHLQKGESVVLRPEGRDKLIVEVRE